MSKEHKKKRKPKSQPNQNINLEEYISNDQYSNFKEFFDYKKEDQGLPTTLTISNNLVFIGMEYSLIWVFQLDQDFKEAYKILGEQSKSYRGSVKLIQVSNDNQLLLVTYQNKEFVIFSLKSFREILQHRYQQLKFAFMVPLLAETDHLSRLSKDQYYEIILQLENNYLVKIPIEIHQNLIQQQTSIPLYKYGQACEKQKVKENRHAKIIDLQYEVPLSSQIQDLKIMDTCYEEFIQCMDERESTGSIDSQLKSSPKKKKRNFVTKLFSSETKEQNTEYVLSNQFYLMAVGFPNKIQVVKIFFGNRLNEEQSKIQLLLNFVRPDAYIYELVFDQTQPNTEIAKQLQIKCACSWGLGSFKETNKRYVLLIVNWGCREYYAFKVMCSDYKIQVIQGGHFYTPIDLNELEDQKIICNVFTNSVFFSFYSNMSKNQLSLMTTSQFEYGVPFTLQQIEKHYNQEKHIQSLSSGQYTPKFYQYTNNTGNQVNISQGVMESIIDGFQKSNPFLLKIKSIQSNFQIYMVNEVCYILNGTELQSIKLKKWDELLYELSDSNEWERCFKTAINIHKGNITLLCNIPENDIQRHLCIKETCCKLALTYMLLQLPNKQLKHVSSVETVMHFLIQTQNEDYLFDSIEDLMVGCGYRNVFYNYLRDLLQQHQVKIPYQHQLKILQTFNEIEDKETCVKLIFSMKNIEYIDPKKLIDFCLQKDLIEPMMYVCTQINDFLTPYMRILTLITILKNGQTVVDDKLITTLTIDQLKNHLFKFISFCFTGQHDGQPESFFTDKQFKSMFKDLFEYLFDLNNLATLFEIDYPKTLEVLLNVFTERIQENLKQFIKEGKEITLQVSEEGLLPETLNLELSNNHLVILSKVYVLIKQAELNYLIKHPSEELFKYSYGFSSNVFTMCQLQFNINHILTNLLNYMEILRNQENTLFDIKYVLKGKVQKDLPLDIVKNEFLHKLMLKIDKILDGKQKALEEIRQKSQDLQWVWAEASCLIKMKRIPEALYLYLNNPQPLLSERVFTALAVFLRQKQEEEFITDWIFKNLSLLAMENVQKLYQLLYTYKKDELQKSFKELKQLGVVSVDQKINQERELDLLEGFLEYLQPRFQVDPQLIP